MRRGGRSAARAALGRSSGLCAALCLFEFVAVVSDNGDYAFVAFGTTWQRTLAPWLEYQSAAPAESAAEQLNCALAVAGAVTGTAVGDAVGRFRRWVPDGTGRSRREATDRRDCHGCG